MIKIYLKKMKIKSMKLQIEMIVLKVISKIKKKKKNQLLKKVMIVRIKKKKLMRIKILKII